MALLIFSTYVVVNDSKLTATVAFTTLSLFNTLRFPLVVLPKAIRYENFLRIFQMIKNCKI